MTVWDKIADYQEQIEDFVIEDEVTREAFRIRFLGSKNVLKELFGEMKRVEASDRKELGARLNALKKAAEARMDSSTSLLSTDTEKRPAIDYSLPAYPDEKGGIHPIQLMMDRIIDIFERIGFQVAEEREIEDEWHNFTAMNTPENHPARDMQDTFYLTKDPTHLLRTHTSSVQARTMTSKPPPIRVIAPGRVYRNETISARSHCQFHQVEGLYIDENVSFADMKQCLYHYAREMYGPEVKIRLRPSYFPFTEPSAEMDVYWGLKNEVDYRITKGTGWLEVMGCGMVDPSVLVNCGIDPERYSGYAFGMGIERQAMFQYQIPDIRLLFENDVRFLSQFSDAR